MNLIKEHQLSGEYLQQDEIRLQVVKDTGKAATSDNWMWLIRGGPPQQPVVLFEYDVSCSGAVPKRLLDGLRGVLQTDGYVGLQRRVRQRSHHPHRLLGSCSTQISRRQQGGTDGQAQPKQIQQRRCCDW